MWVQHYEVLIIVSNGYPSAKGRLPTRYSPVRRFPRSHFDESPVNRFSLDLHVLGTPPAFILSQDQTLNKIVSNRCGLPLALKSVFRNSDDAFRVIIVCLELSGTSNLSIVCLF